MTRGRVIRLAIAALILSYPLAGVGMDTLGSGLSLAEMDWNGDGRTTIGEFFDTMNVGVQPVEIDSKPCREVYALKDGWPIKTLCP